MIFSNAWGGGGRVGGWRRKEGGWKVVTLGWKNLEEYKGESNEKGWQEGEGTYELAAVGRFTFAEWGWVGAGRGVELMLGVPGEECGCRAKRLVFILPLLLPPLRARRRRKDKKLNRCQEGAAATRKRRSVPH